MNELYTIQANAYAAMTAAQFLCSTSADLTDFINRAAYTGKLILISDPFIDDFYVFPDGSKASVYGIVIHEDACYEPDDGLFGDY